MNELKDKKSNEFIQVLKSWKDFSGRARRREYWMYVVFLLIWSFVAVIIDVVWRAHFIFPTILNIITFVPSIAVCVRRLHDVGKSGYWIFISLIPIIGILWLLYLMVQDGEPGTNRFGLNPKEV